MRPLYVVATITFSASRPRYQWMVLIESRFKAWPGELSSEEIAHWKRAVKSAWVAAARSIVGWTMMRHGVLAVSSLRPRRQASVTLRGGSRQLPCRPWVRGSSGLIAARGLRG